MRFRAKLAPEQVSLLYSVITPLSRLAAAGGEGGSSSWTRNGSILYFDSNVMRLSTRAKNTDYNGMSCFAELQAAGGVFLEHRIESAAENNGILLELDLGQLRLALQSIISSNNASSGDNSATNNLGVTSIMVDQSLPYTVLKLAKRNGVACLCLDAAVLNGASGTVQVHQTIPVRVLKVSELAQYQPPSIPPPNVKLEFTPAAVPLRAVMDRMRNIAPTVYLNAACSNRMTGELSISMNGDGASIRTYFSKLTPHLEGTKENIDSTTSSSSCRVKVDCKKLCACLQWQTQHHAYVSSALLCLIENEMLVLHVTLNPRSIGFFTYYVPVHYLSGDPCEE